MEYKDFLLTNTTIIDFTYPIIKHYWQEQCKGLLVTKL